MKDSEKDLVAWFPYKIKIKIKIIKIKIKPACVKYLPLRSISRPFVDLEGIKGSPSNLPEVLIVKKKVFNTYDVGFFEGSRRGTPETHK